MNERHLKKHEQPWRRLGGGVSFSSALLVIYFAVLAMSRIGHGFILASDLRRDHQRSTSLRAVETEPQRLATGMIPLESLFVLSSGKADEEQTHSDSAPDDKATAEGRSNLSEGSVEEEGASGENNDAKKERLAKTRKAEELLARRKGTTRGASTSRTTSVGAARVGSATIARNNERTTGKLLDAIRKASTAATKRDGKEGDDINDSSLDSTALLSKATPMAQLSAAVIRDTVAGMLDQAYRTTNSLAANSMGLFGEPFGTEPTFRRHPIPGTILVHPTHQSHRARVADRLTVRVATSLDDLEIANLRLSVFSDFSPEMRKTFCSRSLQVLSSRRNRGATCIVASVPRYGSLLSMRSDIMLGSAECSFHEFYDTMLGQRRLHESLLYVTEVAVSPSARRKGVGSKLMMVSPTFPDRLQSMEELCRLTSA